MLTRDAYIALLEKRATDANETSVPHNDSAEAAAQEYRQIQEDSRQFLGNLFSNAGAAESQQTAEAKKIWSSSDGTLISGNPLMKVAMYQVFHASLNENGLLQETSPVHRELAFNSFCDELEKIATSLPGSNQALALASRNKMRAMNPKIWDLSNEAHAMGITPKPLMGSGTSIHTGGFLSKLGLK